MTVKELIKRLLDEPLDNIVCDSEWKEVTGIVTKPQMGMELNHTYLKAEEE